MKPYKRAHRSSRIASQQCRSKPRRKLCELRSKYRYEVETPYDALGFPGKTREYFNFPSRETRTLHISYPKKKNPEPRPEFMKLISEAIESAGKIEIVYQDFQKRITERRILPEAWVGKDRFTAICELRGEPRDFRVCRIQKCRRL